MSARFSIITPLLNRAVMLPVALQSLVVQQPIAFEHIVVDGGSTDGAREIALKSGADVIDAPGSSIYDALNIGIDRAQGEIVCLLNSDDRFAPNALTTVLTAFSADASLELVRGRARVEQEGADSWTVIDDGGKEQPAPTLRNVLLGASNINACFFRRDLAARIGPFNTSYRISADREWLTRALLSGARVRGLDEVLYIYRTHADSLTIGRNKPSRAEWVREHLGFAKKMLADRTLKGTQRAELRAFFAKETTHLATLSFSGGRVASGIGVLFDGFRVDPTWPLHAVAPLANIARRRLWA